MVKVSSFAAAYCCLAGLMAPAYADVATGLYCFAFNYTVPATSLECPDNQDHVMWGLNQDAHCNGAATYAYAWKPWVPGENANCTKSCKEQKGVTATVGQGINTNSYIVYMSASGDHNHGYTGNASLGGWLGGGVTFDDGATHQESTQQTIGPAAPVTMTQPDAWACRKVDCYWRQVTCNDTTTVVGNVCSQGDASPLTSASVTCPRYAIQTKYEWHLCTSCN